MYLYISGDMLKNVKILLLVLILAAFTLAVCPNRNPAGDFIINGESCQYAGGNVNVRDGKIQVINGGELNLTTGVTTTVNGTGMAIEIDSTSVLNITDSSVIQSNETTNYMNAWINGTLWMDGSFSNETKWILHADSGPNLIQYNVFRYCNDICIDDSSDNLYLELNDFYDFTDAGLYKRAGSDNGDHFENVFYPTGTPTYSVNALGSGNAWSGNFYLGGTTAGFYSSGTDTTFNSNIFSENTYNTSYVGPGLYFTQNTTNHYFVQDVFSHNNGYGVRLNSNAYNITFDTIEVYNNTGYGLYAVDGQDIVVSGSTFTNNTYNDIYESSGYRNNVTGTYFYYGSKDVSYSTSVIISGENNFWHFENMYYNFSNALYTFYSSTSSNGLLDSNGFYNCSTVYIVDGENNTDTGTYFEDEALYHALGVINFNLSSLNAVMPNPNVGYGILINGSQNVVVYNPTLTNHTDSIRVYNSEDIYLQSITLQNFSDVGVDINHVNNLNMSYGTIVGDGGGGTGLSIFDTNNSFINGTIINTSVDGIVTSAVYNNTYDNVTSHDNSAWGIYIDGADNLIMYNTYAENNTYHGLYANTVDIGQFLGGRFFNNTQNGLNIDAASNYLNITGVNASSNSDYNVNVTNTNFVLIEDSDISTGLSNGVYAASNSANFTIQNCTVLWNVGDGIEFHGGDSYIYNNYIWENAQWQIYSNGGDYSQVSYNNISGTAGVSVGVLWSNGNDYVIDNNDIWDLDGTGIEEYFGTNLTIYNNHVHNVTESCWRSSDDTTIDSDNNYFTECNKYRNDGESVYMEGNNYVDSLNDTLYNSLEKGWTFNESSNGNFTDLNCTLNDYINFHIFNSSNVTVANGTKAYAYSIGGATTTFGMRAENVTNLNIEGEYIAYNMQNTPTYVVGLSLEGTTNGNYVRNCTIEYHSSNITDIGLFVANTGSTYTFTNMTLHNNSINLFYSGYNFTNSTFTDSTISDHATHGIVAIPQTVLWTLGQPSGIYLYNTTITTPIASFADIYLNTSGLQTYATNMTMNFTINGPPAAAGGGVTYLDNSEMRVRWYHWIHSTTNGGANLATVTFNVTDVDTNTEWSGTTGGTGWAYGYGNQYDENSTGYTHTYDPHGINGTRSGYTADNETTTFTGDNNITTLYLPVSGAGTPTGGYGGGGAPKTVTVPEGDYIITFNFKPWVIGADIDSAEVTITDEAGSPVFEGEVQEGESLEIPEGIYNIIVRKDGYVDYKGQLVIDSDKAYTIDLVLTWVFIGCFVGGAYLFFILKKKRR